MDEKDAVAGRRWEKMNDERGLEKDSLGLWAGGRRWKWVIAPRQGAVARSGWFLGRVEGPE